MSRAYRIKVSESASRIIRATDHVSTQLEILDILPCSETAGLLKDELLKSGFVETEGGPVERSSGNITIQVDPVNAEVVVSATDESEVELSSTRLGHVFERSERAKGREELSKQAKSDLDDQQTKMTEDLQQELTDELEAALMDVQKELGQVVNRVTANALKIKASRMGEIKELTEDPESGSLTIVLEV